MTNLIAPIFGPPVRILNIEQDTSVDDQVSGFEVTQTRRWNILTNETPTELTIYDVIEQVPQFSPGFTIGKEPNRRKLQDMRLRETESTCLYSLECDFVPYNYKTPFFVPIEWSWESTVLEIPAYRDVKGKPLVTTAGEPIVGQVRRLKCWIISGTRNVPGVPKWFRDYGVSVNSDKVKLDGEEFQPKELQLQKLSLGNWTSQEIDGKEYRYRPLSFEFWFNPLTWTTELLNMGFNELSIREYDRITIRPDGSKKKERIREVYQVRATDSQGAETTNRVFLDKFGRRPRDADGIPKVTLTPKEIVTLKFDLDEQLPYAELLK